MEETQDINLERGGEENIKDNASSHLNGSLIQAETQAENISKPVNGEDFSDKKQGSVFLKLGRDDLSNPLSKEELARKRKAPDKQKKNFTPLIPVPDEAPHFTENTPASHNKEFNSKPTSIYLYHTSDGSLVGYMVRWDFSNEDGKPKKSVIPYVYVEDNKGKKYWRGGGFPEPRPLYNLFDVTNRSKSPVIVVEGEKVANALKPLVPDCVVTTSAHGSKSPHKTDWSAMKDRDVIICPDFDEAGIHYGDQVCLECRKSGARSIRYLSVERIAKELLGQDTVPQGYDLGDAVEGGLDSVLFNQAIENFCTPSLPDGFRLNKEGNVEYSVEQKNKNGEVTSPIWKFLCGYLVVTHLTRDKDNQNWAKTATLIDGDGIKKEVDVTASLLAGDGNALAEFLMKSGLTINIEATKKLKSYLAQSNPSSRRRTVDRVGWYKKTYVLPNKVYGKTGEEVIALRMEGVLPTYHRKGTLAEWQENVGKYLKGNSRLQGSVLIALASSLLTPLGRENLGLHLVGHSSVGKSTALRVACSVYGSEFRSWRTTDNSAESWAVSSNDNLLILDDIGQASAESIAEMTYMLGNGSGKGRANRKGVAREVSKFNVCTLSSGETGVSAKLREGKRKLNYQAGQAIRLMELPADAGKGFGIFDTLHDLKDGASLSNHLKASSKRYCGVLGDAWLTHLTENQEECLKLTQEEEQAFLEETPLEQKADGQVKRAQAQFALMAGAGEVAIQKGFLNWTQGSAIKACQTLFQAWMSQRGGVEAHEVIEFIKRTINFLHLEGSSRFEPIGKEAEERSNTNASQLVPVRTQKRAGFFEMKNGKCEYFVFPDVFDGEVIQGGDKNTLLSALVEKGILEREKGHFTKLKRLTGIGRKRGYCMRIPEDS